MPLYEYEHLLGWANVQRHAADEITLLCDAHHREKTSGLLPLQTVLEANAAPFNLASGVSKPYDLHYAGSNCVAIIGGNTFTTRDAGYGTVMAPLSIDNVPVLGFVLSEGHLLLNINLFNEANELVLQIKNNQLVYSVSPWDIRLVGRRLEIREAIGKFFIEMTFEVPNRIVITRGRFLRNGVEVVVNPDYLLITNNHVLLRGCSAVDCPYGFVIGPHNDEPGCLFRLKSIARYSPERAADAIAWAEAKLAESRTVPGQHPLEPT